MDLYKYTLHIIIVFFIIRLGTILIKKLNIYIRTKTEQDKIKKGIISIKDFQLKDYDRFIECINYYLYCNFYDNVYFDKPNDIYITEGNATLNTQPVYIYCVQNEMKLDSENEDDWTQTGIDILKIYIAKLVAKGYKKGVVINNSSFTDDAIEYMYKVNHSDIDINVTLIDGYDFTRLLRSYKESTIEEIGEIKNA